MSSERRLSATSEMLIVLTAFLLMVVRELPACLGYRRNDGVTNQALFMAFSTPSDHCTFRKMEDRNILFRSLHHVSGKLIRNFIIHKSK